MITMITFIKDIILQENNEKQEDRLAKATLELAGACLRADGAVCKKSLPTNITNCDQKPLHLGLMVWYVKNRKVLPKSHL